MELQALTAIGPLDGRYRSKIEELAPYFSEFGLIRYRLIVEIEYLMALDQLGLPQMPPISAPDKEILRQAYRDFSPQEAAAIKALERTTNHDVKALEYWIKEQISRLDDLSENQRARLSEFVHFGLTSQDVNNTAVPMLLRDALQQVYHRAMSQVLKALHSLAVQWKDVPMLAHTHGQPASPTTVGKELYVFVDRLTKQFASLRTLPFPAKFGGATGNFNAHQVAYPHIVWRDFANRFVNHTLGLERSQATTQIDQYDGLSAIWDNLRRINVILIDLCRDLWTYISMDYFKQKIVPGEVGSSAMPHKVNPIDFENAEGNLGIANALFDHLSNKLPLSRLQRDLTDSTVLRNIGVPIGHSLLALSSLQKGLSKLELNASRIEVALEANWAILAEPIQTILRREGYPKPYEKLKELTRTGAHIGRAEIQAFIETLDVPMEVKNELKLLTPATYTGDAGQYL
ncbi:MAG: adenylosuccinate lyase [Bacteroidetes bacterium]|jgi:adenylosuccinate lyase|nr:adenylosuccinate lyase [Bacteroidota bacterium]